MNHAKHWCLWSVLGLAVAGCASRAEEAEVNYPFVLSAAEVGLARELAETHVELPATVISPRDRVCFVKVELLPECQAACGERRVMVTYYRYADDSTLLALIDLRRREVVKTEAFAHFPTGLAREEMERAEVLVHGDTRLQTLLTLANPEVKLVFRPLQISDEANPLRHHRLVRILLRQGDRFCNSPRVVVDLTTETVHITSGD